MRFIVTLASLLAVGLLSNITMAKQPPNVILVMADDQGWGETSYNGHPILKTPHLDAMAESGLRMNRFYAGAPVCSPTRGAVLTGRSCYRVGGPEHGDALRHQEITLPAVLAKAGYHTAHFGKWHLNGLRGPGVPIWDHDPFHPGTFGFQHWTSVTNFYDRDPLFSDMGKLAPQTGDSSDVVVARALEQIERQAASDQPFFTVIWYGTPHSPFKASAEDNRPFTELNQQSMHHYGELVALDRSVGTLRAGLRKLGIEKQTVLWYCSDNGGLKGIKPGTVGPLRGNKGDVFEGGLRVPGIIEWPGTIQPRQTEYPASVMDIMPTVLELAGIEHPAKDRPADGISLAGLLIDPAREPRTRKQPICFRYRNKAAIVSDDWKLVTTNVDQGQFALYDLANDTSETTDVSKENGKRAEELEQQLKTFLSSSDASEAGADYPEGNVDPSHPAPMFWVEREDYQPFLDAWKSRWEYQSMIEKKRKR